MKNIKLIGILAICLLSFGCASILPGNDPIAVRAEQVERSAIAAFDAYVHIEYINRTNLAKVSTDFLKVADNIRRNSTNWVISLDHTILAYKHNRAESNKVSLATALATVSTALAEAESNIAKAAAIAK